MMKSRNNIFEIQEQNAQDIIARWNKDHTFSQLDAIKLKVWRNALKRFGHGIISPEAVKLLDESIPEWKRL